MGNNDYDILGKTDVFIEKAKELKDLAYEDGFNRIIDEKLYRIVDVILEIGESLEFDSIDEVIRKFERIRQEIKDDLDSQKVPEYEDVRCV